MKKKIDFLELIVLVITILIIAAMIIIIFTTKPRGIVILILGVCGIIMIFVSEYIKKKQGDKK